MINHKLSADQHTTDIHKHLSTGLITHKLKELSRLPDHDVALKNNNSPHISLWSPCSLIMLPVELHSTGN